MSEPDYNRYGRPPRRAGRGRTLVWLALIVIMVGAAGLALARDAFTDDPPAPVQASTAPSQKLLIREGLRREDVAALLDKETGIAGSRYLALTGPGTQGEGLAHATKPTSLEGFLFPATYDISASTTARELVDEQLEAYAANTSAIDYSFARRKNLTRFDVLTIASMIEREVVVSKERPIVASVIYNRLKAGMRLDIDATVQYAVGSWVAELTASDLAIDSPYNTRRFMGLPPGPIASPGADSIQAAAHPSSTPYLYYVARNDGTGRHFFSSTPAQFDIDVQRSRAAQG